MVLLEEKVNSVLWLAESKFTVQRNSTSNWMKRNIQGTASLNDMSQSGRANLSEEFAAPREQFFWDSLRKSIKCAS